jgi:hypothetical protein
MDPNNFESLPAAALETVTGGADDGSPTGTISGDNGTFTTGGTIGGDKKEKFTTGGSF